MGRSEVNADISSFTVVTLASSASIAEWNNLTSVSKTVSLKHFAHSGARFGHRSLGLGVDAIVVSLKALLTSRRTPLLATNPWIALALRCLTRRQIVFTGIYASPGSRQWRILTKALLGHPVVTFSENEVSNWRKEGGRGVEVLYGNTFGYSLRSPDAGEAITIVIAGSSDRDYGAIAALENQVLESGRAVSLLIAVGGAAAIRRRGAASVERFARVDQEKLGEILAKADICYLPLLDGGRAAGHMVLVGSLEAGTPVVHTGGGAMENYTDGTYVRSTTGENELLMVLLEVVREKIPSINIRNFWTQRFSRSAYLSRLEMAMSSTIVDSEIPSNGR